jgi:hypothetical protein
MAISNNVCRNILDTQSVIKTQIANILLEKLSAGSNLNKDVYGDLLAGLSKCIDDQTNSLIDRVLNEFRKKY